MRYLSIYKTVERNTPPSPEEMERMGKAVEEQMRAGRLLATEGCMPTAKGARVRFAGGNFDVIDGPFAESREVVGGFAIFRADSKEEAIDFVKNFLQFAGNDGECEVRQLYEMPASGD